MSINLFTEHQKGFLLSRDTARKIQSRMQQEAAQGDILIDTSGTTRISTGYFDETVLMYIALVPNGSEQKLIFEPPPRTQSLRCLPTMRGLECAVTEERWTISH